MQKYCAQQHPVPVSCVETDARGNVEGYDSRAKVTYVDTSGLMKYTMPGTEGGGHSDIYRAEIGRFMWTVLDGTDE
jgi:hypothetical protein